MRKSGLTEETIQALGLYSARPGDIPKLVRFDPPGVQSVLVFPYPGEDGFCRVKVFPAYRDKDGHTVRYLQRPGSGVRLYRPPLAEQVRPDPTIPLGWVEGEKKAAKACQEGVPCYGLGGLWNWLEEGKAIGALDTIAHVEREETIVPDSDVWSRPELLKAVYAFGKELEARGAKVSVVLIPPGPQGEKRGLDDYLVAMERQGIPAEEALATLKRIPLTHKAFSRTAAWWKEWVARRRAASNPHIHTASTDTEPVYTALFEGLVDLVEHNGSPAFLVKDGGKLSILPQVEQHGVLYLPPPKEQIPWLLPRGEEVLKFYELQALRSQSERDGALYDDLLSYHKAISELPGEEYYDLLVAWDFHTYLLEAVQYSPIICLFAVPERGKSRTGKGMIHVAYRGIHVESLRDAYLVRVAHDLRASLFFDVKDIWQKAEKNGSEDILLHRFEKGAKVPRVLFPDRGAHRDIVYYSIFGPTVIGTNEGVHRILETRAVPLNMPETSRRFENDVTPELSLLFKERLIAFRAAHLGETFADLPKPAAGRLGDILKPLQQMIRLVKPEREPSFLRLVRELEAEKLIEKADSLEAQILMTLIGLKGQVERGILPVKVITDAFNKGKSEKSQMTYQRVGRRLSAMGFKKARASDGASAIIWDEESIERMKETYGLRKTSETSETSETSVPITDVTDVFRSPFTQGGQEEGGNRERELFEEVI